MSLLKHSILILIIASIALAACAPTQTPTVVTPVLPPTSISPTLPPPTASSRPSDTLTPTRPAPTSTPRPTAILQPTSIPYSTLTPIPTSTPYGPLSATGPHLAYMVKMADGSHILTILNQDASGRETFPLPDDAIVGSLDNALSPNGEWLAFHTGSAGALDNTGNINLAGPFDLTLKLMHLPDGKITTISKLLSSDYPANFSKVAALLIQSDPDYSAMDQKTAEGYVGYNFIQGIKGVDWSPDSRYLAFSGEMDGPTSDLYVYDVENATIKRLTDGIGQMTGFISWSPDGKWILHGSDNPLLGEGMSWDLYVVRADGTGAKKIDRTTLNSGGWLSSTEILVSDRQNVIGNYDLRIDNPETGERRTIWDGAFHGFFLDQNTGISALCAEELDSSGAITYGIYIFPPDKPRQHISVDQSCVIFYRGSSLHQLVVQSLGPYSFSFVTSDEKLTPEKINGIVMSISPDHNWMLVQSDQTLVLYDEKDAPVRELASSSSRNEIWRSDSAGFFYWTGSDLYYMQIPDGEPVWVDKNVDLEYDYSDSNYRWVR